MAAREYILQAALFQEGIQNRIARQRRRIRIIISIISASGAFRIIILHFTAQYYSVMMQAIE